jgi:hypothetical protein
MYGRFRFVERVAFSLVVLFALVCLATVVDRRNPELRLEFTQVVDYQSVPLVACSAVHADLCVLYPFEPGLTPFRAPTNANPKAPR